jgi:transmembrane sensor
MNALDLLSLEDKAALEAAALWWERLRVEPAAELSAEFLQWMSEPRNAKALGAVRETMASLDVHGATPRILDMRRSALARLRHAGSRPLWVALVRVAAVLLLCAAGAGGYLYYRVASPIIYETEAGERRLVSLPDGSRISLDSDSAIDVRYRRGFRAVTLDRGRARFDVAHDASRPFSVTAGAETVVAVGTAFNVEKIDTKILVTLIQGRVVVKSGGNAEPERPPIRLTAGQQMTAIGDRVLAVQQVNLDTETAWEAGQLIFRGEALGDAVQRVNRYTSNPITVAPSAAAIRVSGVFNAGDVGSFISAITGYFPVDATTDSDNRIRLQKRR